VTQSNKLEDVGFELRLLRCNA